MARYRRSLALTAALLAGSSALTMTAFTGGAAAASGRVLVNKGSTQPIGAVSAVRSGGLRKGASFQGDSAGAGGATGNSGSWHGGGADSLKVRPAPNGQVRNNFLGLNIVDNKLAAGFSLEPPDQGICVGNGKVLELVNVVGRVYTRQGAPVTNPFYLNTFFKEDPDFANSSDPSCYYDPDTRRFYADMLFYDSDPTTLELNGQNRIDIAVSDTSDPAGTWQVYSFDVTADGPSAFNIGDYPQIGADREGIYITTNSYPFFEDGFGGAQLYAMSKKGLAAGSDLRVTKVNVPTVQGRAPFTLRPTTNAAGAYATESSGTEYMLSSQAGEETGNTTGTAKSISLWALSGTNSLAPGRTRNLALGEDRVWVDQYGTPPQSQQKDGSHPLGECLSDVTCSATVFGLPAPFPVRGVGRLDSSDTRMHQTVYSNGLVYGALDTAVTLGGKSLAGIAWYVVRPRVTSYGGLDGQLVDQGQFGLKGNNLIYPAFGVTPNGKPVMAMGVVGKDYFPSAAYVTFDRSNNPSPVHIVANGAGPTDGFSEYNEFASNGVARPRWGDYAATAIDPSTGSIWISSEYIDQTCTLATYIGDTTCGGSRTTYANWATRVTEIRP